MKWLDEEVMEVMRDVQLRILQVLQVVMNGDLLLIESERVNVLFICPDAILDTFP